MVSRSYRARSPDPTGFSGGPKLTFAKWLLTFEKITDVFAKPILLVGFFIALAWIGVFETLYPWAHLLALVVFVAVLFESLGKARNHFQMPSSSAAKRRVEEASGLRHRPLDVLSDRLAVANDEQSLAWRVHVENSKAQLQHLHWPRWGLSFANRDPYALRCGLLILLGIGVFSGWGSWGTRIVESINPALGSSLHFFRPTLDAWITPPEYTGIAPIMIATPAGALHHNAVIDIPEGSTITAHLAEKSGEAPELYINGQSMAFAPDNYEDFGVTAPITSGDTITIRRGWRELGSWKVHIVPDATPQIALNETPSTTEQKSVKLSWQASDAYGVASVNAKITPRESVPGLSSQPIDVQLAAPQSKDVKRVSYEDLTASPWAGLSVRIQLSATDAAGHVGLSEPADFVLPERIFFNPLARALIHERKKLLQNPGDETAHNEAANIMAGMAISRVRDLHGDALTLMALRAGAVRLVLDHTDAAAGPVADILWQTALHIEEGNVSVAERNLRQAQKDLADALDHGADQAEIQKLIDGLHQALARYLAQLSAMGAARPPMNNDLEQALGERTNMLSPQDLERMLEQMRDMSAAGALDAARQELANLQQLLENLRTNQPEMTAEQKKAAKLITALRDVSQKQKQLLEDTFRHAQDGKSSNRKLAVRQEDLSRALRTLLDGTSDDSTTEDLDNGQQEMQGASLDLKHDAPRGAATHQNDALASLQKAIDKMADSLKSSMFMVPMPGSGSPDENYDPFGRSGFSGFSRNDHGVRVPDRMEARRVREILNELQRRAGDGERSKTERDYIDRLLQNF